MKNKPGSAEKFTKHQWDMVLLVLLLLLPIAMYAALINSQGIVALLSLLAMCVVMVIIVSRR